MTVPVKFIGGPVGGQTGRTGLLTKFKIIVNVEGRTVSVYRREDELVYVYNTPASAAASQNFDRVSTALAEKGDGNAVQFDGEGDGFLPPSDDFEPPQEWEGTDEGASSAD